MVTLTLYELPDVVKALFGSENYSGMMNLVNCQVGIYANLNSSEAIIKQRMGRLLRHPNPVIIVPYFVNTREDELAQKMLEDYNPELVKRINNIEEIQI